MFFFFKQKTAYEMSASLVGSEMCIRDRTTRVSNPRSWECARVLLEFLDPLVVGQLLNLSPILTS